jgi:hypothetical protein
MYNLTLLRVMLRTTYIVTTRKEKRKEKEGEDRAL